MRKLIAVPVAIISALIIVSATARADDRADDIARIDNSRTLFRELMSTPDKSIPRELLESAKCLAIIPGEKKVGFIVGGEYGKGVAMCRTRNDGWSAPVFIQLKGGSVGFQAGASSTDIVMVFRNRQGFQRLLSDKFKIGADASAAAGPVGRDAAAATDLDMRAEILTYSRSRGVFAGISLNGAVVEPDRSADHAFYTDHDRNAVLNGEVTVPSEAKSLIAEIRRYTGPANDHPLRSSTH